MKKIQRKQQQIQQSQTGSESGIQSQSSDKSKGDKGDFYRYNHVSGNLTDSSADSPQFSLPPLHYMNHSPDGN